MILLAITNNGVPFFIQGRPGYKKQLFTLLKFKTMTDQKDEDGNLLSDDQRLTWGGEMG